MLSFMSSYNSICSKKWNWTNSDILKSLRLIIITVISETTVFLKRDMMNLHHRYDQPIPAEVPQISRVMTCEQINDEAIKIFRRSGRSVAMLRDLFEIGRRREFFGA